MRQEAHMHQQTQYTNTDNAENFGSGRLVRFTLSDGSQTAINSLARATHGSTVIDNNFKLLGCAFMYVEMIYDSEKMPNCTLLFYTKWGIV